MRWSESDSGREANDDVLGAQPIESAASSRHVIEVSSTSTVDPGEPVETGVRTKWWMWDAPEDDRYTWRLGGSAHPRLRVAVFDGESVEALGLVVENDPDAAPFDFVCEAVSGQRYWISAGFATGDIAAYTQRRAIADVMWGPTPDNDDVASASALEGAEGSIAGRNEFATTQRGQRTNVLGHSTLWWTYEAPASGWYRFSLDSVGSSWVLTVHRDSADGLGGLAIVRSSIWQKSLSEPPEVVFYAEVGSRYTIGLGTRGAESGEAFGLRWSQTDSPVWLRFVGRLADGDTDSGGETLEMRGLSDREFNESGEVLYLGSSLGLQVFARDSKTGSLSLAQSFDDYFRRSALLWTTTYRNSTFRKTWRRVPMGAMSISPPTDMES